MSKLLAFFGIHTSLDTIVAPLARIQADLEMYQRKLLAKADYARAKAMDLVKQAQAHEEAHAQAATVAANLNNLLGSK